ncbi:MAG: hypothetical protein ACE5E5_06305 [Phycisphaerae bacterium]
MRFFPRFWGVSFLLFATPVVLGRGLPENLTLGNYVPGDAWFFMDFGDNPENAWLDDEWSEVCEAFHKSGIHRDLISLVTSMASEENRADLEASIETMTNLVRQVQWSDLFGVEASFAMRMAKLPVPYDYIILMRGTTGSGKDNLAALSAIVREVASWSPTHMTVTESNIAGVQMLRLGAVIEEDANAMAKKFGDIRLHLFGKGDLIGVVFGGKPVCDDVIARINGEKTSDSMLGQAKFNKALKDVPAPEDGVVYVDVERLINGFSSIIDEAIKQKHGGTYGDDKPVIKTIKRVLDLADVVDYSVTTLETQGRKQLAHEVARIHSDKLNSPVCKIVLDRKPFAKFDQYIPSNATSFLATGFIGIEQAYDTVTDFIKTEIPDGDDADDLPDGEQMITAWNLKLSEIGFDPKEDIFSWLSGEIVSVSMPPEVVTPMSSSDSVLLIRVSDPVKAQAKVNAAIDWIAGMMQGGGQGLMITDAAVNAEGFKEIVHPMLAMFVRPVVGVKDEWLIIGSSVAAVNKCLAVSKGESPSISECPRFKREGLCCDKPVHSISFTDTSKFGEELAGAVGMIGMFGGMATAQIPDEEGKKMVQSLMGMVMKLAPVLQKLDFFSSEASVTTQEGNLLRTESVVTYKSAEQLKAQSSKVASQN